jgi:hypothetical protein
MWRSKLRTTARASTSAPLDASSFTISGWRRAAAHMSAVWPPKRSVAFTFAPRLISSFAASTLPVRATLISAVCPSAFGDSTSAPAASSSCRIAASPASAASSIGVTP